MDLLSNSVVLINQINIINETLKEKLLFIFKLKKIVLLKI